MTDKNLWGGRFSEGPAEILKRFNDSFSFDIHLLDEDIEASIAWAQALGRANVITSPETETIVAALYEIRLAHRTGKQAQGTDYEDVHSFVEGQLHEKIGPLAGRLHTGRSRNDQVATDFRLYLRKAISEATSSILDLVAVLAARAREEAAAPLPGYTHLQQAEVITFGHWCMAYVEMLLRDLDRLDSALVHVNECPLGSGALAGTPLDIDRHRLAVALGFDRPTANSLDAVADRDSAAEYLFATTMLFSHLSHLSEDLIMYGSAEFGFVVLPDAYATGSSRMPQKKNPDILELTRGHAGRLIGELTGLLSLLKGLPLAYNKDLQLDKEPVFRTRALVGVALPAVTELIRGVQLERELMRKRASADALLATELTDAMARRAIPFRRAHEIVSRRIAEAAQQGRSLLELGPSQEITARDLESLDIDLALSRKSSFGGTAPFRVREAAAAAIEKIAARLETNDHKDRQPSVKSLDASDVDRLSRTSPLEGNFERRVIT